MANIKKIKLGAETFNVYDDSAVHFSEGLSYILSSDETTWGCTGLGTCKDTDIKIPNTYQGKPVTWIDIGAFANCISLKRVILPESITSIYPRAFYGCTSLESIIIPDSVTLIEWSAFEGCTSLESIVIPDSVTSIGGAAFRNCTKLTIYCEAESKPEGWLKDDFFNWNSDNKPVVWGAALDIPAVNDKLIEIQESTITELLDTNVKLSEDLYAYAPIGMAQKASNGTIGSGSTISASNPGKIGTKSESLKDVFNKIFGTEVANQPTINKNNVYLSISSDVSSNSTTQELGTAVSEATATYTITLSNTATAPYGYRCGTTNTTTSNATFYYPATKAYNNGEAQVKITLPSDNTGDTAVTMTKGTLVNSTTTGKILYCNFKESDGKVIKFTVKYPATNYTTSQQTRYGKVEAEVTLGNAQTDNTATAAVTTDNTKKISAFLAYKPVSEAYEDATVSISGGTKDDDVSAITIAKGYVPYTYCLATSTPTTLPTSDRSQILPSSITVSGGVAEGANATYLYIFVPSGSSAPSKVSAGGFAVNITKVETSKSYTVNNGKTYNYDVYKTNGTVVADTFVIE